MVESPTPTDLVPVAVVGESPFRRRDTMMHWALLGAAVAVIGAAVVLRVQNGERVVLPLVDAPLPGSCTYKSLVGIECPGCGLTRCFISLAHGQLSAAWSFNPAGLLFFTIVAAQVPFRAVQIWRIRIGLEELRWPMLSNALIILLVITLFTQWAIRHLIGIG